MKTWKFCMAVMIGTAGVVGSGIGQDNSNSPPMGSNNPPLDAGSSSPPGAGSLYYRAHELSIDGFGSGSLGQQYIDHFTRHTLRHDARFGAGVGVNYFITRYLGVGGDAYSENTSGPFIDSASGNLIGRLPIGNTGLAPYVFGGAGHQFDEVQQTFGQAGAGVEFRFTPDLGLFVDARYVFPDETENYGVARAGLRVSF